MYVKEAESAVGNFVMPESGVGVGNFGKSEWGVGVGNFGKVGYFTSDSATLVCVHAA